MFATNTVTTFVTRALAFGAEAFASVFHHDRASRRGTTEKKRKAKRLAPTLLLSLPLLATLVPEAVDSTRTIDVTVSRHSFSPARIEVRVGERVRLNVVSIDGTHGFQVKALGLNAGIPAGARSVTVGLTATDVGTFEISCPTYCGRDHGRMTASLIVTPRT